MDRLLNSKGTMSQLTFKSSYERVKNYKNRREGQRKAYNANVESIIEKKKELMARVQSNYLPNITTVTSQEALETKESMDVQSDKGSKPRSSNPSGKPPLLAPIDGKESIGYYPRKASQQSSPH